MNTESPQPCLHPPVSPAASAAPSATGQVNSAKPPVAPPPAELYWLAAGTVWNETAEPIRQAAVDLILPAYRMLVADCPDPLERASGMSLVYLMWLEVCQQHKLGQTVSAPESIFAVVAKPAEQIARHLSLLAAKQQVADLLFKSRIARQLIEKSKAAPPAASELPHPGLWTMFPMAEPEDRAAQDDKGNGTTDHTNDTHRADAPRSATM